MGVPAFFRWLSERYPKIMMDCVEQEAEVIGTVELPVDITQPNPNGVEFDNLYLDMNGIIHPCFHPEDKPPPTTEAEVFQNIFEYIDRLVAMVRPRKVVYMAIDGVAPRAKMNQQRSRRFRAASDREEQKALEEKLRAEFKSQGVKLPERKGNGDTFDSNVITPGTEFMDRLAMALQWYIHKRLNEAPGWHDISVVLSDANTPGEGEHKFMQFVREQRSRPGWNPNTVHCVYGLDADLIHLALASHEPHFYILREIVFTPKGGTKEGPDKARALAAIQGKAPGSAKKPEIARKPFQFLKIGVLREYLYLEFADIEMPFQLDPERLVDDFVLMCFFVGNDFLPHMPTLDIREKGIELMMKVYRDTLPYMGGYMANGALNDPTLVGLKASQHQRRIRHTGADLDLRRVGIFIGAVGQYEDKIFQARMRKMRADKNRYMLQKQDPTSQYNQRNPNGMSNGNRPSGPATLNSTPPKSFLANKAHAPRPPHPDFKPAPPPGPPPAQPSANTNRSAASSLRERLAAKKADAQQTHQTADPQIKHEDEKDETKLDEACMKAEDTDDKKDIKSEDHSEETEKTGQGVHLGKRSLAGEDGCTADKVTKVEEGEEKVPVDESEPPAKRISGPGKDAPDSVMDLWSELTDAPTEGVAEEDDEPAEEEMADPLPSVAEDSEAVLEELEEVLPPCADDSTEAEEFRDRLKQELRSKADMAEDMFKHEEQIRLGDEGWKGRYYEQKFGIAAGPEQDELIAELSKAFVEGLCWVMRYYFEGVASWRWFFPFHYAPFASDLVNLEQMEITFDLGEPFEPFNQLMGVFPAGSKHALPKALQPLFDDPNSPILDFYPKDFQVDMNGKRFAWQGVALLPFIDETRLLEATGPIIKSLPAAERRRNERRPSSLFARRDIAAGSLMIHQSQSSSEPLPIPAEQTGYSGIIARCAGSACPEVFHAPPFTAIGPDIYNNVVAMALYTDPPHQKHIPSILSGTQLPERVLSVADTPRQETLWCERHAERMQQRRSGGGQFGGPMGAGGRGMGRHPQGQPHSGRGFGGRRGADHGYQGPPPSRPPMGGYAPVQPTLAPGMAPMYAQGQEYAAHAQQAQYQYVPAGDQQMGAAYVVVQGPGGQMAMQPAQGQMLMAPQGYQQVAVMPQMVQPGQSGTFFAGMRPAPAQPHVQGDVQMYGADTGGGGYHGGRGGSADGLRPAYNRSGYGGGGYGRQGGGYGRQGRGNRYDALRDPRSRR